MPSSRCRIISSKFGAVVLRQSVTPGHGFVSIVLRDRVTYTVTLSTESRRQAGAPSPLSFPQPRSTGCDGVPYAGEIELKEDFSGEFVDL
eukprot:763932-Hanusia_phi.AAC.9